MAETKRFTLPGETITHHKNKGSIVVASGTIALDGSNPTAVACLATHGIGTVLGATVSLYNASAPGDGTTQVSCAWTGSTLNIYGWTHTGATDPTLAASTGTEVVSYIVVGVV